MGLDKFDKKKKKKPKRKYNQMDLMNWYATEDWKDELDSKADRKGSKQ